MNVDQVWFTNWDGASPDLICPFHALYPIQENAEQAPREELTDVLPHIHPRADKTHIHRPSGGDSSGSGGILLTWCQGLNSVGSAWRRQLPRRACSIYAALPPPQPTLDTQSPTPIHWYFKFHSMNSFVKFIPPSEPFQPKKNVFLIQCYSSSYLGRGGPQEERAVKIGTV